MKVTIDYIFGKTPIQYQLVETIHSFRMERRNKNTCVKIYILIIHDSSWKHYIYSWTSLQTVLFHINLVLCPRLL